MGRDEGERGEDGGEMVKRKGESTEKMNSYRYFCGF